MHPVRAPAVAGGSWELPPAHNSCATAVWQKRMHECERGYPEQLPWPSGRCCRRGPGSVQDRECGGTAVLTGGTGKGRATRLVGHTPGSDDCDARGRRGRGLRVLVVGQARQAAPFRAPPQRRGGGRRRPGWTSSGRSSGPRRACGRARWRGAARWPQTACRCHRVWTPVRAPVRRHPSLLPTRAPLQGPRNRRRGQAERRGLLAPGTCAWGLISGVPRLLWSQWGPLRPLLLPVVCCCWGVRVV